MRLTFQRAIVKLVFCALPVFCTSAQGQLEESPRSKENADEHANRCEVGISSRALTPDDGLAVIAAALDRRILFHRRDLHSGPGVDTYDAPHWKRRGQARFYRYVKKCAAPDVPNHLLLTHQDR